MGGTRGMMVGAALVASLAGAQEMPRALTDAAADRFAAMALRCVHQE